ncbi:hypothetical protein PMAYCL1PPCAC_11353, partial [Pristionchus mayeri]
QRNDRSMCDVTVKIGNNRYYAHKEVLIDRIPFFRALFDSEMVECESGESDLSTIFTDIDCSIFVMLLDYVYTGLLTIDVTNVQDLMMSANFLAMVS